MRIPEISPKFYIYQPNGECVVQTLTSGRNVLGRAADCEIVLKDASVSRYHAEINYGQEKAVLCDLKSTNGTHLNRERIQEAKLLMPGDILRIGKFVLEYGLEKDDLRTDILLKKVSDIGTEPSVELFLKVARQLNEVLDIGAALPKVAAIMKEYISAEKCQVLLSDQFDQLAELGFPTTIARVALETRSAILVPVVSADPRWRSESAANLMVKSALCVPVIAENQILALIYMYKTEQDDGQPFTQKQLDLAVGIGHQVALTLLRMKAIERFHQEQRNRQLLARFFSPDEVDYILEGFRQEGLPEMTIKDVSVMFTDIATSTQLAERIGPRQFGQVLQEYYQDVTDIVFRYGGVIKYSGDGVMAVFGMTSKSDSHAINAVNAGWEIIECIRDRFYPNDIQIQVRLGVNTGPVVVGYLGNEQRMELTVLGETVNTAFGFQKLSQPNTLTVGPVTASSIGKAFNLRLLGAKVIKSDTKPVQVHQVMGVKKDYIL